MIRSYIRYLHPKTKSNTKRKYKYNYFVIHPNKQHLNNTSKTTYEIADNPLTDQMTNLTTSVNVAVYIESYIVYPRQPHTTNKYPFTVMY